jgi:hypothetical protein
MSIDYGSLPPMAEPLTAEQQRKRRQAVRDLMVTTPFIGGLGVVFERYEPDDITIRLPFREGLTNDGIYFHGGVIASVMDTPARQPPGRTTISTRACAPRPLR